MLNTSGRPGPGEPDAANGAADESDEDLLASYEAVSKALAELGMGELVADEPVHDENSFEYPLAGAMDLLPKHYVIDIDEDSVAGQSIVISLENLFDQLARGKVAMPLSKLAYFVPVSLIYDAVFNDSTEVQLSLPLVVRSISPDAFEKHMPPRAEKYVINGMDDPFEEFEKEEPTVAQVHEAVTLEDDEEDLLEEPDEAAAPEPVVEPPAPEAEPPTPVLKVDREEPAVTVPETVETEKPSTPEPVAAVPAPASSERDTSFEYPLSALLSLMSPEYAQGGGDAAKMETVTLNLPDLFDQLAKGKVTVSPAIIAEAVPAELLAEAARADNNMNVTLSLQQVVDTVGPDRLTARITARFRSYDIDRLADPFQEPAEPPKKIVKKHRKQAKPLGPRKMAAMLQRPTLGHVVVEPHSPALTARKYVGDSESELSYHEFPGNININIASVDELRVLSSVTRTIAAEIVAYREKHGEFKSIFELLQIPGIDKTSFRRITGMTAARKQYHRRRRLATLLGIEPQKITDLDLVAGHLAQKPGFSGCIISDGDGLVLAADGAHEMCEEIAAIIPRMMRRISEDMHLIRAGRVGTVSIAIDGVLYSIAASRNVALTAVHEEHHVSETDLAFIRKVQKELAWLLSLRAYVGPTA